MIVNSTTNHHHFPDDDPAQLTAEAIVMFLDQALSQTLPVCKVSFSMFFNKWHLLLNLSLLFSDLWRQLVAGTCLSGLL